jgi:hypothetical protein
MGYSAGKSKPSTARGLKNGLDLGDVAWPLGDESKDGGSMLLVRRQAKRVRASMGAKAVIAMVILMLL